MPKRIDDNGFWEYKNVLLTKEGVFPYLGQQIDQAGTFGLEPKKVYMVYRPKEEVCAESFVASLQNLPLVNDHTMIGEDFTPAERKGVDGVMYNVRVDGTNLRGDLKVFSEKMKADIQGGKRELSLGYKCKYRREMGQFGGKAYDFVQFSLSANHIALVDTARMGSDCRVMDCMCYDTLGEIKMPTADEIIEQIKNCSDEDKAKVRDFLASAEPKKDDADPAKDAGKPDEGKEPKKDEPADKKDESAKDSDEPKDDDKKDEGKTEDKQDEPKKDEPKEEPAKDAKGDCMDSADAIRKACQEDFNKAMKLAERCRNAGITIATDGLYTEVEVAKKVCALDCVKLEVTDATAVATLNGYLSARGSRNDKKFVTVDSADGKKASGFDFASAYKAK